jgi:hypothetical protein
MSCKISISSWEGNNKITAAENIAKVFRLQPEKANEIMNNLASGIPWSFNQTVSNQQGKDAQKLLRSMGFKVDLSPAKSKKVKMGLGVNLYTDQEEFEEEPAQKSFFSKLMEKIGKKNK